MYEMDAELEESLYTALVREAAPEDLMERVMARIAATRSAAAAPSFDMLRMTARSRWTSALSVAAHAAAIALIAILFAARHVAVTAPKMKVAEVEVRPYTPPMDMRGAMGGGGGGGDHDPVEAVKGRLPLVAKTQIAPPQILRIDDPKLAVEPTVVVPEAVKLPDANLPNMGVPQSPQVSLASQGGGSGSGFGNGTGGGIGSGHGNGVGPGTGGGYGGGLMRVGGGVSHPQVIYAPDPEFSDEARRAKYQGICMVSVIVDARGNPQNVHVVRALGMGLDEKAVEAVKRYKFRPAMYQGHAVAVEIQVQVDFHIY